MTGEPGEAAEPEETENEDEDGAAPGRSRGGCLTSFLLVSLLFSIIAAGAEITIRRARMMSAPALLAPNVGYLLLAFAHVLELVFVVAIFRWKRWGVYGFFAMHAAAFGLDMWVGEGLLRNLVFAIVPPALLVYLVRRIGGESFE